MDFIRKNTPKQYKRNGYIVGGSTNYISSSSTLSNGGTTTTITNYLPAYLIDGFYQITNPIKFINENGAWEFYKRDSILDETTGEANEVDTMVMTIKPNTITFGDGSEVLTTNHFYLDDNGNLHTKYNIVSDGEIVAYVNGYSSNNGGGTTTTINVVDNLLSTSTTDALSANQGRILNEKINTANHSHTNKSVIDGITSSMVSEWNRSVGNIHTHTNKSVIDTITSNNITNWNTAFTNNHTHATNKNTEVYNLIMGNYGGVKASDTDKHIMRLSDGNVSINANGNNLYLGGDTTLITYLPTYFDNGDGTTTPQWNSFNSTNLYMQMPLQVALQSHNNTQPPITTNSTNVCTNLNADKVDGYDGTQLVNNVGINGDNITITKGTTTTTFKPNYANKAQLLITPSNETYLSFYDTYVNLTGTGGNINIGSQAYKNNNYNIQFITNDGTAEKAGTVYWNYINGTSFTTQVPHRIFLQSTNNNQAPLQVNSTNLCTNLNADYIDGYHASSLIKTNGNQTITGNLKIVGNLEIEGTITASDDVIAYSTSLNQSLTSKIKSALSNVENATTIDEIKNILITLKNSI